MIWDLAHGSPFQITTWILNEGAPRVLIDKIHSYAALFQRKEPFNGSYVGTCMISPDSYMHEETVAADKEQTLLSL